MATGMRHDALVVTGTALRQHARRESGTAAPHDGKGLALTGQQHMRILRKAGAPETIDDRRKRNHLTAPQRIAKRSIKALMRSLAASWVWLVRWV